MFLIFPTLEPDVYKRQREGFANLRPGADYDGLRDAALCRAKADWLVGINATRLFSVLYHRTLNIGRVMSPTLALIVQREAEIDTFKPVPFYTVALELPGLTVSGAVSYTHLDVYKRQNLDYSDDESPLSLKSDFILSLCELIVGGKDGLQPVQKTIIDRCVRLVYQTYLNDPRPENMPILEDLYNLLRSQEEKEAQYIATALEIYVTGSLNVFNHQSNVDINNRIVCYDIKELGKQLKKIGMLVVQDQVWNRVTINRAAHKSTRYYIDEMHLLLKEEQTAAYTVEIWKRFRKWGGIPTGITQNVKDLLSSREAVSYTHLDVYKRQSFHSENDSPLHPLLPSRCRAGCRGKSLISGFFSFITTKTTEK